VSSRERSAEQLEGVQPADQPTDRAARKAFFSDAAALTPYVGVEIDGQLFLIDTRDTRLGSGIFAERGRKDMKILAECVRLLGELGIRHTEPTFVDVGAHIGTTTVSAVGRHGFVGGVAIEPAPDNFRALRLNLVANELESVVTAVNAAVADEEGERQLVLSGRSSGEHALDTAATPRGRLAGAVPTRTVTLDGLVARGVIDPPKVALLWIDAPGSEVRVLEGATSLLEVGVPVTVAVRPRLGTWGELEASLTKLLDGYTTFVNLRHGAHSAGDLGALLGAVARRGQRATDLLCVRS
jgi:FkbM family methyltransferase